MPFSTTCTFSVITHIQLANECLTFIAISDKLATFQRMKCDAYDRDGADRTFSQDLKIYTCLHIYIYYL